VRIGGRGKRYGDHWAVCTDVSLPIRPESLHPAGPSGGRERRRAHSACSRGSSPRTTGPHRRGRASDSIRSRRTWKRQPRHGLPAHAAVWPHPSRVSRCGPRAKRARVGGEALTARVTTPPRKGGAAGFETRGRRSSRGGQQQRVELDRTMIIQQRMRLPRRRPLQPGTQVVAAVADANRAGAHCTATWASPPIYVTPTTKTEALALSSAFAVMSQGG